MKVLQSIKLVSTFCAFAICLYAQSYAEAFNSARRSLSEKRFNDAFQQGNQAIRLDNRRWEAYFLTGSALVGLQQPTEARKYFQTALNLAPESAKADVSKAIEACRTMVGATSVATPPEAPAPQRAKTVDYYSRITSLMPDIHFLNRCVMNVTLDRGRSKTVFTIALNNIDRVTLMKSSLGFDVLEISMKPGILILAVDSDPTVGSVDISYNRIVPPAGFSAEISNILLELKRQCGG